MFNGPLALDQTSIPAPTQGRRPQSGQPPASGETNQGAETAEHRASEQQKEQQEQQAWPTFYILNSYNFRYWILTQ